MRLLDRSESPVLKASLIRQTHHCLPLGRLGPDIRNLGLHENNTRRFAHDVTLLCADQTQLGSSARDGPLSISPALWFEHSAVAAELQKHLRLMEAQRLISSKGKRLSQVAFEVECVSVPQFSREYARIWLATDHR